jgi:hypothetical protein
MALFGLLPQGALEAAEMAPEAMSMPQQHQGMFGVKGTLRDILGGLGDAFLLQAGGNPMYRQIRQQERLGDVMSSMGDNPLDTISKIGAIDPALGQKYYDEYSQSQDRKATIAAAQQEESFKQEGVFRERVAALVRNANPQTYGPIVANMKERAKTLGLESVLEDLPDTYDQGAVADWTLGSISPKDQIDLGLKQANADALSGYRDRQAATAEGNLNARREKGIADVRLRAAQIGLDANKHATNARMNATRISETEQKNNRPKTGGSTIPRPRGATPPGGSPAKTGGANGPHGKYVNQNGVTYVWDGKQYKAM